MIDVEQLQDRLRISHFGKDGTVQFKEVPIPRSEKFKWDQAGSDRRDPFFLSWDGKPVKKVKTGFLNKFRVEEFLATLGDSYLQDVYEFNYPDIWFCDIEVEVNDIFPDPDLAATPVLTIALVNSKGECFVLGTKPLSGNQTSSIQQKLIDYTDGRIKDISFQYLYFPTEAEMLDSAFSHWFLKAPLLTGWNFVNFDWKFLINRAKRCGVDVSQCSLVKKMKDDNIPVHKVIVDYLDLYKKWDRVIKVKENSKLDTVALAATGISKVKYNGTFMDLYTTDFETYVYYNVVDTILVYLIDKKLKTMQTFLMLGNITKVEAMKAFSPIWMTEAILTREFFKRRRVVANINKADKNKAFEGAYVKTPQKGLYEWIATFDFASLYPSTMRQWNISPEAFMGRNIDIPDDKKWIKTASGSVFDNSQDSVMRTVLTDFFGKRKVRKTQAFEIEREVDILKKLMIAKK